MESIGLATYSVRIRKRGNKKNHFKFDQIKKEDTTLDNYDDHQKNPFYDLIDILNEIFVLNDRYIPSKTNKIIQLDDWIPENSSRIIYGLFGYGDYGNIRKVLDTEDENFFELLSKKKAITDPFYFLFKLPKGSDIGLLIVSRKSVSGLKTILNDWINQLLLKNKKYFNLIVDLKRLTNEEMLNKYLDEGKLHTVRYITNTIPSDDFDEIKTKEGKMELKINYDDPIPLTTKLKNRIRSKKSKENNYFEFDKFKFDDLKVEVELNGKKRVFRSGHIEDSSPYIDISDEVKLKDGNPDLDSINKIARNHASEFFSNIWDPSIKR